MKIKITERKEVDVKYLLAEVGARYWEDATVNGIEDVKGDLIPCREGGMWKPLIDLDSGKIVNWEQGKTANVHYKSCDNNVFHLLDKNKNMVKSTEGYVIEMMSPEENGYGDYVIMTINEDGIIKNFKADFWQLYISWDKKINRVSKEGISFFEIEKLHSN